MKRPPLIASLLLIVALAVLCGLGGWQIKRAEWKHDLLARLAAAEQTEPAPLSTDLKPFSRARAQGLFLPERSVFIGPRTWKGQPGWHLITPLALADGSVVLVNRGWVADKAVPPQDSANITGMLRAPEKPNMFVPRNDAEKDNWLSINVDEIAEAKELVNVMPLVLYQDGETLHWSPPDNHRQYAVFWFSMAGIMLAVFWLRFMK